MMANNQPKMRRRPSAPLGTIMTRRATSLPALLLLLAGLMFLDEADAQAVPPAVDLGDPTPAELTMYDWSSGLRIVYCSEKPVTELISPFRTTFAPLVTTFCAKNASACNLKRSVSFGPENVLMLEGSPRREYSTAQIKFMVALPPMSRLRSRQMKPLLPRSVLSTVLSQNLDVLTEKLGWNVISHEKYPRFDEMTEFMNVAIIPILLFSIPLMVLLAYWTTRMRSSHGSEGWLVTGSSGGKNAALRRTLEIIEEQRIEIERQRYEATRDILAIGPGLALGGPTRMLVNVAKGTVELDSSFESGDRVLPAVSVPYTRERSQAQGTSGGAAGMQDSSIYESSIAGGSGTGIPRYAGHYQRRHSRRNSSIDVVEHVKPHGRSKPRKSISAQSRSRSHGGQRKWKAGSLILGGLSHR